MLSDLFGLLYSSYEDIVQSYILNVTYVVVNTSGCVGSILCRLYFTYFETAVQTWMSDVG